MKSVSFGEACYDVAVENCQEKNKTEPLTHVVKFTPCRKCLIETIDNEIDEMYR